MTTHRARCRCGGLTAVATGDVERVSVCHCLNCQRRAGSAFAVQVRFAEDRVTVSGDASRFEMQGDEGGWAEFQFCPRCGDQVAYRIDALPGLIAIPLGAFEDPYAFTPNTSGYEARRHPWTAIFGDDVRRQD